MQKGEHWWTSLEALTHPEPPLLSMALPRWALPVDARDTWPCRSCHQFSHCVVVSLRALNTPSLLCFQEIWLQQEQEYISKEMYKHCLYGYCYHVNETPNFHFPPDLTPAPREVYQGSRHCMNAEMQPLGVPLCLTSSADIHLCHKLCSCGASQTFTHLLGDIPPTLGLAPFNWLLRHWRNSCQRATSLWDSGKAVTCLLFCKFPNAIFSPDSSKFM